MFWSGKPQFNTAQGYSEYVKEQERQQQIQDAKERQQQQYNADMRQIAQDALTQAKKSNDIAKENKGYFFLITITDISSWQSNEGTLAFD